MPLWTSFNPVPRAFWVFFKMASTRMPWGGCKNSIKTCNGSEKVLTVQVCRYCFLGFDFTTLRCRLSHWEPNMTALNEKGAWDFLNSFSFEGLVLPKQNCHFGPLGVPTSPPPSSVTPYHP